MPSFSLEQGLRRGGAEQDEKIGRDQFDLAADEGQAQRQLLRRRRAIAGRTPGHDIGDIDVCAVEADGGQHLVEQLPGAVRRKACRCGPRRRPGPSPTIMIARIGRAIGENQLGRGVFQGAAVERGQFSRNSSSVVGARRPVRGRSGPRRHATARRPGWRCWPAAGAEGGAARFCRGARGGSAGRGGVGLSAGGDAGVARVSARVWACRLPRFRLGSRLGETIDRGFLHRDSTPMSTYKRNSAAKSWRSGALGVEHGFSSRPALGANSRRKFNVKSRKPMQRTIIMRQIGCFPVDRCANRAMK